MFRTTVTIYKWLLLACVVAGVTLLCHHHSAVGAHMLDRQDAAVQKPSTSEPWTGLQLLALHDVFAASKAAVAKLNEVAAESTASGRALTTRKLLWHHTGNH